MKEHYAAGYDPLVLQGLNNRVLEQEAAFFLPYLKPDMQLLDCGCGPGALTIQLAQRLCNGHVIGIDREGSQLQMGRDRAVEEGVFNVRFEAANVYALPFDDNRFDAVFAHAVVYHLREPEAAVEEIYRVLKPGGVFAIRDADSGGTIAFPTHEVLERAWAVMGNVMHHSGMSFEFGRTHRATLRRVGFERVIASASCDSFGTPEKTQGWAAYCQYFLTELHAQLIVDQGWASQAELEEMAAAFEDWGNDPDAFYSRCRCEAIGWKPQLQR